MRRARINEWVNLFIPAREKGDAEREVYTIGERYQGTPLRVLLRVAY